MPLFFASYIFYDPLCMMRQKNGYTHTARLIVVMVAAFVVSARLVTQLNITLATVTAALASRMVTSDRTSEYGMAGSFFLTSDSNLSPRQFQPLYFLKNMIFYEENIAINPGKTAPNLLVVIQLLFMDMTMDFQILL